MYSMRFTVISALVLGTSLVCCSPAPSEPTRLLLVNSTKKDVVLSVELCDQTVHFVINAGSSFTSPLRPTKDDRAIIARQAGSGGQLFASPCKVFTTSSFNAAMSPGDTFGAFLVGDDATGYSILYYLKDGDDFKALVTETKAMKERIMKHKDAMKQALEKKQEKAVADP